VRTERSADVGGMPRNGGRAAGVDANLQLRPVSARSRAWFAMLAVVLPVALSLLLPLFGGPSTGAAYWIRETLWASRALEQWLGPVLVAIVAGAIWLVTDRLLLRHDLRIEDSGIDIRTTLYRRRLRWAELDLPAARVVDIDEHPENKPLFKSNGVSIPGFRSGWFRSRAFARLFVATAGGSRLLWLPTTLGYTLLLEPGSPAALLERLRQRSGSSGAVAAHGGRLR
jgi:hypothetical protein